MEEVVFSVKGARGGTRLDKFLVEAFKGKFSRTFIRKLIDDENVRVNGKCANAHHKVRAAENIRVTIPSPKALKLKAENIPLEILYEDKDLLVLNKAPNISMHPVGANLSGTLVNALLYHCKDLSGIGGVLRPGIVHRLDKETSGILVVAKNDLAHKNLAGQFRNRTAKRKYIALVKGVVQLDNGRIEIPIARRKKDIIKMGVSFVDEKRKNAITNYRVLKRFTPPFLTKKKLSEVERAGFTMLELLLETGRTHQIRVHLSHMGHPIIGDKLYGSRKGMERQALHAKTLGFYHPGTKKFMEFDSDLPEDMRGLIERGKL